MFYAIANTILRQIKAAAAPFVSFIWNLNTNLWNAESRIWGTYTPPPVVYKTYRFEVTDSYGDGWNNNVATVQRELTPGVWTNATEAFQNPTDANVGITGDSRLTMTGGAGPYSIEMELEVGINTRLVASQAGSARTEPGYKIYDGATLVAELLPGTAANWTVGTVQVTFTS